MLILINFTSVGLYASNQTLIRIRLANDLAKILEYMRHHTSTSL